MELIKQKEREWQSKCETIKGTMQEISQKINYINAQSHSFVVATHQPIKVAKNSSNHIYEYETIIFYKEKIN